jgi:hypothetical protein
MSTLTSLLDEKASRIAEQVDDLGRETAESLHAAASTIRKGSQAIEDFAESTANCGSRQDIERAQHLCGVEQRHNQRRQPDVSVK